MFLSQVVEVGNSIDFEVKKYLVLGFVPGYLGSRIESEESRQIDLLQTEGPGINST